MGYLENTWVYLALELRSSCGNIKPLNPDDIPELSTFLITGFHAESEADFASPDVLRWKYLEDNETASRAMVANEGWTLPNSPQSEYVQPNKHHHIQVHFVSSLSFVARSEAGRIIGHVGICRTYFEGKGITTSSGQVATAHIIDWLGSQEHRSIGMSLLRLLHQEGETQFALGATPVAVLIGERTGYEPREVVAVYTYVLRADYWLRNMSLGRLNRWLRVGREWLDRLTKRTIRGADHSNA